MKSFFDAFFGSALVWAVVIISAVVAESVLVARAVIDCHRHNDGDVDEEERARLLNQRDKEAARQRKLFIFAVRQNLLPELYEYRLWKQKQARKAELKEILFARDEEDA